MPRTGRPPETQPRKGRKTISCNATRHKLKPRHPACAHLRILIKHTHHPSIAAAPSIFVMTLTA